MFVAGLVKTADATTKKRRASESLQAESGQDVDS